MPRRRPSFDGDGLTLWRFIGGDRPRRDDLRGTPEAWSPAPGLEAAERGYRPVGDRLADKQPALAVRVLCARAGARLSFNLRVPARLRGDGLSGRSPVELTAVGGHGRAVAVRAPAVGCDGQQPVRDHIGFYDLGFSSSPWLLCMCLNRGALPSRHQDPGPADDGRAADQRRALKVMRRRESVAELNWRRDGLAVAERF